MKAEKVVGTVVVLIVILGFLRCGEILLFDEGSQGTGGNGGADGGLGGNGGDVCGNGKCEGSEDVASCMLDCGYDLVVVVDAALSETLASSLQSYVDDLEAEGQRARIEPWEAASVVELKQTLFGQVDRHGVEGALLVGNLPAAFFEHSLICLGYDRLGRCVMYEHEEFPTDVFLQDRDAAWEDLDGDGIYDAHGDLNLEIYVSRLQVLPHSLKCQKSELFPTCPESYDPGDPFYASTECLEHCPSRLRTQVWTEYETGDAECCGPYFLRRYFERLHRYRASGALVARRALVFVDDDFEHMVIPPELGVLYPEVVMISDPADSSLDEYLEELSGGGAELVHQYLHSTAQNLYFYQCAEWEAGGDECLSWYSPRLHRTQIGPSTLAPSRNLEVSFLNMYNCHASRFTEPNLGMAFTLQTDYGLATVGNTRKGGMTDATVFHEALGQGASWGEAYKRWYNEVGKHDDRWFLGVVLTGDPTLTIPIEPGNRPTAALEALGKQGEPVETPPELLATDPPGTFEDYKRKNPQFFQN